MKNLLVGNGINIQFDHISYTTKNIILRLLDSLDDSDFPVDYIVDKPALLKAYLGQLFLFARDMLDGNANEYISCNAEKEALEDFIERYGEETKTLRIPDIGFEDYYLIHDLICHKVKLGNPDRYYGRESMKMAYYHSIYNKGEINTLYMQYTDSFREWLFSFNSIFTTNYDSNVELATGKEVHHIHGQFDKYSEVYDPNSFRNKLGDNPIDRIPNNQDYMYLHSTAISTYCGDYKALQIRQSSTANKAIEEFSKAYLENETTRADIDSWVNDSNQIVANMGKGIKLKVENPELIFQENYAEKEFGEMKGSLVILGLSPYNDYHIFETINASDIDECTYYYFDESECLRIKKLLTNLAESNQLHFESVRSFWEGM